jgi:nucleoside-diphosphate-sugar epimerase
MKKILVTGASGYIGKNLCRNLIEQGFKVIGSVRTGEAVKNLPQTVEPFITGNIDVSTDWSSALKNVESVVHLAAIVHKKEYNSATTADLYRKINVEATANLARQALMKGISSFVFLSSAAVYGVDSTQEPLSLDCPVNPKTLYGRSKWEAEQELVHIFKSGQTSLTVFRPTMVYGLHAPGNFARLTRIAKSGIPLPIGSINNRRFFVSIEKLVSLIVEATQITKPGIQVCFACDENPLSTKDLFRLAAEWEGKKARIFPFPPGLLKFFLIFLGKRSEWDKIAGDFIIHNCTLVQNSFL